MAKKPRKRKKEKLGGHGTVRRIGFADFDRRKRDKDLTF